MRRIAFVLRASIAALLVAGAAAQATQVVYRSPKELAGESSRIVRGRVVDVRSFWNVEKTQIFTEARIKVDETYKGGSLAEARIVQLGGVVGHVNMHVEGALSWTPREEVLLFLETGPTGALRVAGFSQGRFAIERDARTGAAFVRSPGSEGVSLVGAPRGRAPERTPLDRFLDETVGRR